MPFPFHKNDARARRALSGNLSRFYGDAGRNIHQRSQRLLDYVEARIEGGVWQYKLRVDETEGNRVRAVDRGNRAFEGLDFASVDYLGLSRHPRLALAAHRAIDRYGIHSNSSGPLMGNSPLMDELREELAGWLRAEDVLLFPNGWSASFSALTGIVRRCDAVVLDELAHQSLQQGASASTDKVFRFQHLDCEAARHALGKAAASISGGGSICLVTEGLFSMDGDSPDFRELVRLCREFGALLIVDVAHDLGATGPEGTGSLGAQGLLGEADLVVGSFSKAFATNGGFAACKSRAVCMALQAFGGAYTYATSFAPASAAIALEAIRVVRSDEGRLLREKLLRDVLFIRDECARAGLQCLGTPSPIVPVFTGAEELGRLAGAISYRKGVIAIVIEFPVVPLGASRYRISMKPCYAEEEMLLAVRVLHESIQEARDLLEELQVEG